jgi:hypothetical protein
MHYFLYQCLSHLTYHRLLFKIISDMFTKTTSYFRLSLSKVPEVRSPSLFYLLVHSRYGGSLFSLDHTHTPQSVGLLLTTQTLYKRQTSMPPGGFEPTIPASAQPRTYALDRAATGISFLKLIQTIFKWGPLGHTIYLPCTAIS